MRYGVRSIVLLALIALGCTGALPALRPPAIDPDAAADAAIAQYDTDQDGKLTKTELDRAPAINFAIDRIDGNEDGVVTAEELAAMMRDKWLEANAGVIRVKVYVTMNRNPVPNATVTFEPESYLADHLHPATGVTDGNGFTAMTVAPEHQMHENARGVAPGLYLVRISLNEDGKERIPAKYNAETTLGVEVAARASYMPRHVEFQLRK